MSTCRDNIPLYLNKFQFSTCENNAKLNYHMIYVGEYNYKKLYKTDNNRKN